MVEHDDGEARRRAAIRLAVVLGIAAVAIYAWVIFARV